MTLQACKSSCFVPDFAQAVASASGKTAMDMNPEPRTKCGVSQKKREISFGRNGGKTSKMEGRPALLSSWQSDRPGTAGSFTCQYE